MGAQSNTNETIYGSFLLGNIEIAIDAHELQEVVNMPDDLDPMPLAPDYVTGLFALRDTVVPVLNMRKLLRLDCERNVDSSSRDCVAIVRVGENLLGMQFDRTAEVLRVGHEQIDEFKYASDQHASRSPVSSVIRMDGGRRLVQAINSAAVMGMPDVPRSSEVSAKKDVLSGAKHGLKRRCITFRCGGDRYGFRIDAVREIIPIAGLGDIGLASDVCIGRIELRGMGLPVMDLAHLLCGKAGGPRTEQSRVIVASIDGIPIGFKVDVVEGIIEYGSEDLQPLPDFGESVQVLLAGCIVEESGSDFCLIDHKKLFEMPDVMMPAGTGGFSDARESDVALGKSTTCLLVNLGLDFVLPVANISEIIESPVTYNNISGAPPFIDGVFNLRRKAVTVVNLRTLYGIHDQGAELEPKLLIAEYDNRLIGLQVDGVKDIVKVHASKVHQTPPTLLTGWSQACKDDIDKVFMSETGVIPFLPLAAALRRVSPESNQVVESVVVAA
ncbi:MAG: chemotaxis protein CheW [Pseudomonadota bacterium]